jgi:hypothetical protein
LYRGRPASADFSPISDGRARGQHVKQVLTLRRGRVAGGAVDAGRDRAGSGRWVVEMVFPKCQKCKDGDLVPLSDFGSQGAAIHFKAWACTNPDCGFNIKIRNGDLYIDEPITSGALHSPRFR